MQIWSESRAAGSAGSYLPGGGRGTWDGQCWPPTLVPLVPALLLAAARGWLWRDWSTPGWVSGNRWSRRDRRCCGHAAGSRCPGCWPTGGCVLGCDGASQVPRKVWAQQPDAWRRGRALQCGTSGGVCPPPTSTGGGDRKPHASSFCPGRDIPAHETRQKAVFCQCANCGLIPPRFLTCGPHRVLCHVLPGQRIPLAKHGMDWLSCICLPGSSGLALGMAVGFVVVTLENRYLGLLRAGRAYRDSPFCPVWGPLPAFQALISTDGRGAMCWGGSRDEHTQNPKEQPLSPLRNPLPRELCGGFQPFPPTHSLVSSHGLDPSTPGSCTVAPRPARTPGAR